MSEKQHPPEVDYSLVDRRIQHALDQRAHGETVAFGGGGPHDPGMEELVRRVGRLENLLEQMAPTLARLDERLNHLATKADLAAVRSDLAGKVGAVETNLAGMPSKTYMWAILGVLVAAILAAVAVGASLK